GVSQLCLDVDDGVHQFFLQVDQPIALGQVGSFRCDAILLDAARGTLLQLVTHAVDVGVAHSFGSMSSCPASAHSRSTSATNCVSSATAAAFCSAVMLW